MEKFIHVERCDSTQDLIKEQLLQSAQDELTVSCEQQINGRGRGSNIWQDSPGTLCFSMTIRPHIQVTYTALEISILIHHFFKMKGKEIRLKWPNDLMTLEEKKCGGVLVQNSESHYYVGIGLNLFQNESSFGGIYETSFPINKQERVKELSAYIRSNRYSNTEDLSKDWLKSCFHLNQQVSISEGDQETCGKFVGLGSYGEALLENSQGTHHLFNGSLRLL
jgi:biotin-[acetyl-CoA-carboxylase] ligase BirA-like protein